MNERRTQLIFAIVEAEKFIREHWLDILSISLTLLGVVLSILEYAGFIDL